MEAEQVDVGEVSSDFVRELIAVDEVKNKAKVRLDGWNGAFDKGDKKINGVGVDSSALVLGSQRDSSADVTGKRVRLWWDDTRRELTLWTWEMLCGPMVAMDWEEQARETAVR